MISTKKHPFWIRGSQVMPKTPKFCWFGAKMGLAHNFTRNDILSYVSIFYGWRTSKQCDLHLQTSFLGVWFRFIDQLLSDPERVQPTQMWVSLLWLEISLVQEISPTKLTVQTERVHPRESRKNIIWWVIWCLGVQMFFPNFFPVFSKVKFFAFLYLLTFHVD